MTVSAKQYFVEQFQEGMCKDITTNPNPEFDNNFYTTIYKLMEKYAKEYAEEYKNRLFTGRDYLMQISPSDLTAEDALEAFGFGRDGLS